MRNLRPDASSGRRNILIVVTFIVFVVYLLCLMFYQDFAIQVALPSLFICLAGLNLYQGIHRVRNGANGVKWYKEYDIILTFAWLSGFAIFFAHFLMPTQIPVGVQYIGTGLPFLSMIALFVYAFFLYRRNNQTFTATRSDNQSPEE